MFVRPASEGLLVPDPARRGAAADIYFLPVAGRDVGDDNPDYWACRVRDGDVLTTPLPPPPAPAPAP